MKTLTEALPVICLSTLFLCALILLIATGIWRIVRRTSALSEIGTEYLQEERALLTLLRDEHQELLESLGGEAKKHPERGDAQASIPWTKRRTIMEPPKRHQERELHQEVHQHIEQLKKEVAQLQQKYRQLDEEVARVREQQLEMSRERKMIEVGLSKIKELLEDNVGGNSR
jgi:hypothetical protein